MSDGSGGRDTESYPTDSASDSDSGVTTAEDATDDETQSARTRYPFTNDAIALVTLWGLTLIVGIGLFGDVPVRALPEWLWGAYAFVCGVAATWAFGQTAVDAWRAGRGK